MRFAADDGGGRRESQMKQACAPRAAVQALHRRLMGSWRIACAGFILALLGACGQKGPLYLPDKKASVVKPVTAAPQAPQPSDATDTEKDDDSQQAPTR
jgi:predicted small lipoprotein YifL